VNFLLNRDRLVCAFLCFYCHPDSQRGGFGDRNSMGECTYSHEVQVPARVKFVNVRQSSAQLRLRSVVDLVKPHVMGQDGAWW
jgi:hypothetical protein